MAEGRTLDLSTLESLLACKEQRELFEEKFTRTVLVTVELALAQFNEWDWDWAAHSLLSAHGCQEWVRFDEMTLAAYRDTMRPFWQDSDRAYSEGEEAYRVAVLQYEEQHPNAPSYMDGICVGMEARKAVVGGPREAENAARQTAHSIRSRVQAQLFAEIYIREGNVDGAQV